MLALAALLVPAWAHANELLVMPYACAMVGGQPLLTPAPEQGHRIIGRRDQRRFSSCSPVNPEMCRQWTVHRFDMDCDGVRVPWVSVVAATNEGSRRAWLLDGRLVLRMGPRWSLSPDDPCAQEPEPRERFGNRRMRRYCADRLAMAPPPVVEMPFGYAPLLGIDGIFVRAAPNTDAQPPLPPIAAAPQAASPAPGARDPMAELFPPAKPAPARPESQGALGDDAPTAPAPAAPPQTSAPPRVAATAPPAPPVTPPVSEAPRPAAEAKPTPKAAANTPPSKVPAAPSSPPAPPVAETSKAAPGAAKPAAHPKDAVAPPPPKVVEQPASPPQETTEPQDGGFSINLFSVFRTTTVGALVAFGGLALGLLTAFALARRTEHARDSRRRPRDLGAVSLDNTRARPPARIGNARGNLPPNAAASAMSRVPGQTAVPKAAAEWGNRMPETRAEALQVLGIGVAPTANEAAIKKIVDGLRQSWHPDLATDEADRATRELRSKQINVAWELLRSQRAVV